MQNNLNLCRNPWLSNPFSFSIQFRNSNSKPYRWHELRPLCRRSWVAGTPNLETQVEMKALTQTSVEKKDKGTASGQRVVLPIIVRIYEKFWLDGRGPTILLSWHQILKWRVVLERPKLKLQNWLDTSWNLVNPESRLEE